MKAFIFPGQGAQKTGMGRELFGRFPEWVRSANAILGYDLVDLIETNPGDKLKDTRYTQPALYVVNAMHYRVASERATPDYLAGHSLGEYNALLAAGSYDFETGLRLVHARGQAMSQARRGSMAAVIGLGADTLVKALGDAGLASVDIANINTGSQLVLSFPTEILEEVERCILDTGAKAFIRLDVGGAFHSRYMEAASIEFLSVLKNSEIKEPRIPVISNVTARPFGPGEIRELLGRQMTSGVQWLGSVEYLLAQGVEEFVECGPGEILSRMVQAIRKTWVQNPPKISPVDSSFTEELTEGFVAVPLLCALKETGYLQKTSNSKDTPRIVALALEWLSDRKLIRLKPKGGWELLWEDSSLDRLALIVEIAENLNASTSKRIPATRFQALITWIREKEKSPQGFIWELPPILLPLLLRNIDSLREISPQELEILNALGWVQDGQDESILNPTGKSYLDAAKTCADLNSFGDLLGTLRQLFGEKARAKSKPLVERGIERIALNPECQWLLGESTFHLAVKNILKNAFPSFDGRLVLPKWIVILGTHAQKFSESFLQVLDSLLPDQGVLPSILLCPSGEPGSLPKFQGHSKFPVHVSWLAEPSLDGILSELLKHGVQDTQSILYVHALPDPSLALVSKTGSLVRAAKEKLAPAQSDSFGREVSQAELNDNWSSYFESWEDALEKNPFGLIQVSFHQPDFEVNQGFRIQELLYALSGRCFPTVHGLALLAAQKGLLLEAAEVLHDTGVAGFKASLVRFCNRGYRIRYAAEADLPALLSLETACWNESDRCDEAALRRRLAKNPEGQFVLEVDGKVVAALFTQRIPSQDSIYAVPYSNIHEVHDPLGKIVQCVAINVQPAYQERRLGDQLLEYALTINGLDPSIASAVAITKCKDFHRDPEKSVERYIHKRTSDGRLADPILRFHELHGAQVIQPIPGYRPLDTDNDGYGVLVRYDLAKRKRQEVEITKTDSAIGDEELAPWLTAQIKDILGKEGATAFALDRPLMEMGLDSSSLLDLSERLSLRLGRKLDPDFFYRYSQVKSIIDTLSESGRSGVTGPTKREPKGYAGESQASDIAIVGVSCRLPGGIDSPDAFWDFMMAGKSAISTEPGNRWVWPEGSEPDSKPGIRLGGYLQGIEAFDAPFFRISPLEADMMDPQQRLLLELSWQALEDASMEPGTLSGTKTGVFVGASGSDYRLLMEQKKTPMIPSMGTGTSMAILANRLSYFYGLTAPSFVVDTACSSSLVAVHEAMQSIRNGSSQQAIVAGINLICHPGTSLAYYDAGMLSPDGRCKTFDASANGYVRSEGAIVMVLKPLTDAIRDGNPIHAILKGSACNHGGTSGGLTVPNPSQQAHLVQEAWADGKLVSNRFGLIETHGTGTPMGDPLEIQGLKAAYFASLDPNGTIGPCVLGAVKTNLGHLEAAAGLAGLLKAVLCIKHKAIPGNAGFKNLNPAIDLSGIPFEIRANNGEWNTPAGRPRVAGVSSFGSGGTNAHVAVEEHLSQDPIESESNGFRVFILSAKSKTALKEIAKAFHRFLLSRAGSGINLDSLVYTLSGRKWLRNRFAMVFKTKEDLLEGLRRFSEGISGEYLTGQLEADEERSRFLLLQGNQEQCAQLGRKFCQGHAQWGVEPSKAGTSELGVSLPKRISGLPTYAFDRNPHWLELQSKVEPIVMSTPLENSKPIETRQKISLANPSSLLRFDSQPIPVRTKIRLQQPQAPKQSFLVVSELRPGIPVVSLAKKATDAGCKEFLDALDFVLSYWSGRAGMKAIVLDLRFDLAWQDPAIRERFWNSSLPLKIATLPVPTVAFLGDATGSMGLAMAALCDLIAGSEAARAQLKSRHGVIIPQEAAILSERFQTGFGELLVPGGPELGEQSDLEALLESIESQSELAHCLLKTHLGRNMVSRLAYPVDVVPVPLAYGVRAAQISQSQSKAISRVALVHDCVSLEIRENGVAVVQMKETEGKNTFTDPFVAGVNEAFTRISEIDTIKAVVLTGYDAYFCAGGTKKLLLDIQSRASKFTDIGIYSIALECAVPVIAAMQGHAIGAGWSMGMYCDFQVYSEESVYCSPYMSYGFTPGAGATLVFPYKLGSGLANEILMLAREYKGLELARRKAVKECYPRAEVLSRAIAIADALALEDRATLMGKKRESFGRLLESLKDNYQAELAMHEKSFVDNADVKKRIESQFGTGDQSRENESSHPATVVSESADGIKRFLRKSLSEELRMEPANVSDSRNFSEMGLDSITGVTWLRKINKEYGLSVPAAKLYMYPSLSEFAKFIVEQKGGVVLSQNPAPKPATPKSPVTVSSKPLSKIAAFLKRSLAEELRLAPESLNEGTPFSVLGLDSITGVTWVRKINKEFGLSLSATTVYKHPNLSDFGAYVKGLLPDSDADAQSPGPIETAPHHEAISESTPAAIRARYSYGTTSIAVIGLAGQYPMADDLGAFWDNIEEGRDCIQTVPGWRWKSELFFSADRNVPGKTYSKWMGLLESAAEFDPAFFNLSPREAINMDPQQRVFLRNAWHCLEDAGLVPKDLAKTNCGVYVGGSVNDYHRPFSRENLSSQQFTGEHAAILAARIAYYLDLRGPCLSIDTACSSSLVAISSACDSLVLGNCDLALAGGVCVLPGPDMHIMASKAGMLSPTGKCRSFDASADGFVPGEGVGVVLLKRLDDAVRDGNRIQAVISGWGVNQDGRTNGITAPNGDSQCSLIRHVHRKFGIDPASIGLMEAHGTGTQLGDPIEADGLLTAFGEVASQCALGSLKSNVGHLLAAAGVAGLTKVILSLARKKIPPTINYERLNPHIEFKGSPFYIADRAQDWKGGERAPRRAAVSSFGFGGTNCHVVVEEYPGELHRKGGTKIGIPEQIFPISAHSRESLTQYAKLHRKRIEGILQSRDVVDFDEYAFTLQSGRQDMSERLAITARSFDQLLTRLDDFIGGENQGEGIHRGTIAFSASNERHIGTDPDFITLQKAWAASGRFDHLANLWTKGVDLDWKSIFRYTGMQPVSIPVYPFSRETYWKDRNAIEVEHVSQAPFSENVKVESQSSGQQANPSQTTSLTEVKAIETTSAVASTTRWEMYSVQERKNSSSESREAKVKDVLSDLLCMDADEIPTERSFMDIGLDSIVALEFVKRLNHELELSLNVGVTLNYPSVDKLVAHLDEIHRNEPSAATGGDETPMIESKTASRPKIHNLDFEARMKESLSDLLFMSPEDIDADKEFFELGLDSIVSVEWIRRLNKDFGTSIPVGKIMDYPTLSKFSQHMRSNTYQLAEV